MTRPLPHSADRLAQDQSIGPLHWLQPPAGQPPCRIDALYLHVPFCFHKCHYCDFYSIVDHGQRQEEFVARIEAELRLRAGQVNLQVQTIFVGGGTPTLLSPPLWQGLLATLHGQGLIQNLVEFTVEANPETLTPALAKVLRQGGVNRISIGAQSFDPRLLKTLERWHDPASVTRAVGVCRDAGINNINLDLIFAIPGESTALFQADLETALALQPDHLSCYGLTYESATPMTRRLEQGQFQSVDEDHEMQMYALALDRLKQAGFEHYEISNWARIDPEHDRRCRHNIAYWHNRNWLGLGPSAASHADGHRWKNQPHLGRYLAQSPEPPIQDYEHLPHARRVGEMIMLSLRMTAGLAESWLREMLVTDDPRHGLIDELVAMGMLERIEGQVRLTRRGLFVADEVMARLL